ncbi:GvpL/GvpF family gas vesicle protein [Nonomuraea lactucae]|uniref:GvpL/GvpF family gas vesicle protein n=1 Tax=Nonomuraea lactucae TaxID=2249762 RepID=UPI000DE4AA8B|nr:GvpL/GvpF family gas vesicle protein [Nonomuraea lactucae]
MAEPAAAETSEASQTSQTSKNSKNSKSGGAEKKSSRARKVGTYLYGIVPADVEVADDTQGVGDPPAEVTLLRHGEIAALVSDLTAERPLGTPGDLMAHERLLDATAAEVPVLPIRFGAVMTGPDEVVEELLSPYHDQFRTALGELEGRAEFVVKGRYEERTVLQEVLDEQPEAARLREEIQGKPEDATRDARIRLGELVNQAITAKREADTQTVLERLAPLCELTAVREPTHEQDSVHLALLVRKERKGEVEEAVEEIAGQWERRMTLRLLGPLAPYDFIVSAPAGQA